MFVIFRFISFERTVVSHFVIAMYLLWYQNLKYYSMVSWCVPLISFLFKIILIQFNTMRIFDALVFFLLDGYPWLALVNLLDPSNKWKTSRFYERNYWGKLNFWFVSKKKKNIFQDLFGIHCAHLSLHKLSCFKIALRLSFNNFSHINFTIFNIYNSEYAN